MFELLTALFAIVGCGGSLLFCGLVGMLIGWYRDNTIVGLLLGVVLGPIGWIILFFIDNRWRCPECGSVVAEWARRCPRCRSLLPGSNDDF